MTAQAAKKEKIESVLTQTQMRKLDKFKSLHVSHKSSLPPAPKPKRPTNYITEKHKRMFTTMFDPTKTFQQDADPFKTVDVVTLET